MAPRPQGGVPSTTTTTGYGSIKIDHSNDSSLDLEETVPLTSSTSLKGSSSCPSLPPVVTSRKVTLAATVLAIVLGLTLWSRHHRYAGSFDGSHAMGGGQSSSGTNSNHPKGSTASSSSSSTAAAVVKTLSSPLDLGLEYSLYRSDDAAPSDVWGEHAQQGPLPTNAWYLNLLSHRAAVQPDDAAVVYTVPYKVDTAPPSQMAGVRVHWPVVQASATNIQMVDDFKNSLSLGASTADDKGHGGVNAKYHVHPELPLSPLGISLQWMGNSSTTTTSTSDKSSSNNNNNSSSMVTHLVRGMPYVSMEYQGDVLPRLYSYNGLASDMEVDGGETTLDGSTICGVGKPGSDMFSIQNEIKLHFTNSDFTWIVFFSKPVKATCQMSSTDVQIRDFQLDAVVSHAGGTTETDDADHDEQDKEPLMVRVAMLDECTTGSSNIHQHCAAKEWKDSKEYESLLRKHASLVPTNPQIEFAYNKSRTHFNNNKGNSSLSSEIMRIDWGVKSTALPSTDTETELLAFALPHHQTSLADSSAVITDECTTTFHGITCLVKGNTWTFQEDLGKPVSFTADRPPEASMIPSLAQALAEDIEYHLPDNMRRGALDTYFSGKLLARVGRVVVIAKELLALAAGKAVYDDVDDETLSLAQQAAAAADLPSDSDVEALVEQLKKGLEIWLTKPEASYLYDKSWGGLINCGCRYTTSDQYGVCNNTFPDCPALASVNEDFGNAFYADHHYHYGYHLYAAAVASRYDPVWAEKYFDRVMWYIRDFANPFDDDYFTPFRQKDWFLGSSWASGIVSAETSPHGRDEESSSEAIAAYEAMTLYGTVMSELFNESKDVHLKTAETVRDAGQLLTATELHATQRYWHVWNSTNHNSTYPEAYKQPVIGMMHGTMASFETWFSRYAVVSYGIQLMPLTPIAERRDDPEWATLLYPLYQKGCEEAGDFCIDNGWSILQAGLLATTGDREEALEQAMTIPAKVFESQGGLGNTRTNLIWYIATRKPYGQTS